MKSLMAASETRLVVVPMLLEVVLKGPAAEAEAAAMFSPARVWQAFSNMLCMYLP